MDALLRWGIENSSAPNPNEPTPERKEFDPGIIDHILGKSDAVQMKEALEIAVDDKRTVDERVTALDNLEMLIEQIDNANNLTPLKMWEPILSLVSSPSDPISTNALWVLGTAIQNNPSAQSDFLSRDPLPTVLSILSPEQALSSAKARSKAVYCLSSALKHNPAVLKKLSDVGGWDVLKQALHDSDITVRRKVAFLFGSLLLPTGSNITTSTSKPASDALLKHGILSALVSTLDEPEPYGPDGDQVEPDSDYVEKALRVLQTFTENGGRLEASDQKRLKGLLQDDEKTGSWGVDKSEIEALQRSVQ